jgi:sugar transferase (PEP-CTERM system associated)
MQGRQLLLIVVDIFLGIVALYLAAAIEYGSFSTSSITTSLDQYQIILFLSVNVIAYFLLDLYGAEILFKNSSSELFVRIGSAIIVAFVILSILYFFIFHVMLGRKILLIALTLMGFLTLAWHYLFATVLQSPAMGERVLVLGSGEIADEICKLISSSLNNFILAGCHPLSHQGDSEIPLAEYLLKIAQEENITTLVVCLSERRGHFPLRDLLACKLAGIEIFDATTFYEKCLGKLMVENLTHGSFIFSEGFHLNAKRKFYKRLGDIVAASFALSVSALFLPVVALLIKMDSRGAVFFSQVRVGEGERPFHIYKFRTMQEDAESETGAVWAQDGDVRITRVGKILRKLRIDEFPQFYNVLKGDMSIIGPRPERPEFVEGLKRKIPYYSERHCVKPGITGWAQIKYRYGACEEDAYEKLRYDLYYLKHFSFFLDAFIFMETVKVMLFGKGAR